MVRLRGRDAGPRPGDTPRCCREAPILAFGLPVVCKRSGAASATGSFAADAGKKHVQQAEKRARSGSADSRCQDVAQGDGCDSRSLWTAHPEKTRLFCMVGPYCNGQEKRLPTPIAGMVRMSPLLRRDARVVAEVRLRVKDCNTECVTSVHRQRPASGRHPDAVARAIPESGASGCGAAPWRNATIPSPSLADRPQRPHGPSQAPVRHGKHTGHRHGTIALLPRGKAAYPAAHPVSLLGAPCPRDAPKKHGNFGSARR